MSWNFRSLSFLVLSTKSNILRSIYYSQSFRLGIVTFICSGILWSILVGICLEKAVFRPKKPNSASKTMLKLRKIGSMSEETGRIDKKSIAANLFVFIFFSYLALAPTIWVVYDNLVKTFNETQYKTSGSRFNYHLILELINLLIVEIKAYFLSKLSWYYPFILAAILQNLLTTVDIFIWFLKFIDDLIKKCDHSQEKENSAHIHDL